uniref:Putative NADH dehydrogenase n=1 Tax=viral metagenome TaxID=1070528 RepID=A0A6H1ZGV3_9ZZZZ
MEKNSRIYIAGHTGLVGSAVVRELRRRGYVRIQVSDSSVTDLRDRYKTRSWFGAYGPEYVFLCAAHAGGIKEAIGHPVEMLSDNILIQTNVINACKEFGVKKLINFGSSCLYPVDAEQPYREEQLGTGKTDENWSYAAAKLAGIELCRAHHRQYGRNFMSVIPCNIYGINDRFDEYGHVIPSLIRKFHEGGVVELWGDGNAKREFLYSDDLAEACVLLMEGYTYSDLVDGVVNIGSGEETQICGLKAVISNTVKNYTLNTWNFSKPSGVPSKLMDSSRMRAFGWKPKTSLEDGIRKVYGWYNNSARC